VQSAVLWLLAARLTVWYCIDVVVVAVLRDLVSVSVVVLACVLMLLCGLPEIWCHVDVR
jgi:hypothetical protein